MFISLVFKKIKNQVVTKDGPVKCKQIQDVTTRPYQELKNLYK